MFKNVQTPIQHHDILDKTQEQIPKTSIHHLSGIDVPFMVIKMAIIKNYNCYRHNLVWYENVIEIKRINQFNKLLENSKQTFIYLSFFPKILFVLF